MSAAPEPAKDLELEPDPAEIPQRIAHLRRHDPGSYLDAIARLVRDLHD